MLFFLIMILCKELLVCKIVFQIAQEINLPNMPNISDLQIAVTAVAITYDKNQALQANKAPTEKSQQRGKYCEASFLFYPQCLMSLGFNFSCIYRSQFRVHVLDLQQDDLLIKY